MSNSKRTLYSCLTLVLFLASFGLANASAFFSSNTVTAHQSHRCIVSNPENEYVGVELNACQQNENSDNLIPDLAAVSLHVFELAFLLNPSAAKPTYGKAAGLFFGTDPIFLRVCNIRL